MEDYPKLEAVNRLNNDLSAVIRKLAVGNRLFKKPSHYEKGREIQEAAKYELRQVLANNVI